ncbi:aldehyde dehydrogenase family protein [Nocardioides carbamazepini]|uniref:aldehyde dehydrogenase family protein n=1 Tax=Nocardioides carbamazepini TaxID=2854259 RepID=UPI00214A6BD6|nr:aldehyde dehydrogenase family protein [Nocardioides carbamazepini]MCR1785993.1 aldehyde dehydrogenase family protein [Nocardioides carbamazepini]
MTQVSYDPRTGGINGEVGDSTAEEVRAAVRAAAVAAPTVAALSPAVRRDWLVAVADALESDLDALVALADAETALGTARLAGEVQRAAGQLRFYGAVAAEGSWLGATLDTAGPHLARTKVPLGPVAVFGASNFPLGFGVVGNDTASAIAAGCPVVAKAHPAHPLLSERLAALARAALSTAGAPESVLGLVTGQQAGVDLVRSPEIAAVGFTGSQAGGLALWRIANEREVVIPVYAEMGTVNPVVVTQAAASRMAEIAVGLVGSFTLGSGQFCTKPGLLLAPRGVDAAHEVAQALRSAAPAPVMLTSAIAAAVRAGVEELVAAGGRLVVAVEPAPGSGWDAPAAVVEVDAHRLVPGSRLLEECFGAVVVVAEYDDPTERDAVLDRLQGALAASVVTDGPDDPEGAVLARRLGGQVGRVVVDDWPTGVAYTWAQHHGGPWPATSAPAATSVGAGALDRFVRPVTFQDVPDAWLPEPVRAANPWRVPRRVDGVLEVPR